MLTDELNAALGFYSELGFQLIEPDDHLLIINHDGEFTAALAQGIENMIPKLHGICKKHLLEDHGLDAEKSLHCITTCPACGINWLHLKNMMFDGGWKYKMALHLIKDCRICQLRFHRFTK